MLVLSRERDEIIDLKLPDGRTVSVMIVDIRGDRVRVGFDAPKDVGIARRELASGGSDGRR